MADELCFSSTCDIKNNSCFVFYDLSLLCSLIFSHPLYFSYFLFFSPYLFKFIFFISPLFFTTTLVLLLSFLTTTFPQPKLGIIQTVVDKLRSKLNDVDEDEDFCNFEDFEIYKIVFHDQPLITVSDGEDNEQVSVMENAVAVAVTIPESDHKQEELRSLECLFEELDRFEDSTAAIETTEKESSSDLGKIVGELQKPEPVVKKKLGSKSMAVVEAEADQKLFEKSFSLKSNSCRVDSPSSIGSYGSMRKEKEWKRTLACKLFEERHNSEGGEEGMDSLWESYEEDNSSRKSKNRKEPMSINQKKMMMNNKKKIEFKYFDDDFEEDDDDEEEFMSNGQLCCLKALKLSAGKMNLGMGKPNLVKISKALKGFGWLHHVGSKNGLTGYPNSSRRFISAYRIPPLLRP
ncbi:uncharacterized protein LOC111885595 isoform X2 [Lactuca sativa]|uniref:uncharacterized protein LOC111885595 isoform X2 n=1 Tax=Lactuca sativa TaxID=4236 RepID=UPI000CD8B26B|nr:uncharacterized protein LOC111885595 isoform X2 [Lactuca sativa]